MAENTMSTRIQPSQLFTISQKVQFGGEGGIRTLGAPSRGTTVFETAAFNQLCHLSAQMLVYPMRVSR